MVSSKQLREIAGEIGEIECHLPGTPDAEEYNFQVQVGLATAVVEILDTDFAGISKWFGFCLIRYGIKPDRVIQALHDALIRQVDDQIDTIEEDEAR